MRQMKESGIEWMGLIPEDWGDQRGKYTFTVLSGCAFPSSDFSTSEGVPLIRIRDITSGTTETFFKGEYSNEFLVNDGDLLIGMDGDFGIRIWDNGQALLNQRCCKIIAIGENSLKYLYYVLPYELKRINDLAFFTTVKHLSTEDLALVDIPIPSATEQQRIADYLDAKCAEIDALIAAKEKTNALLRERRQSIIYEAVTKGLNPDVPMKDSGIEWIGQIPAEWTVCKIKHFVIDDDGVRIGPFGSALTNRLLENGEYNVYSQANLIAGDFSSTKHTVDEETFTDLKNYEVIADDVCVSMMGTIGKCRVVPNTIKKGIMDSHLIKIRLKPHVNPKFFEYVYDKDNSGLCFIQMKRDSKGTIMDGLNSTIVKNLYFPLPSREIQDEIVAYLEHKCEVLDRAISANEATIQKLKEYRQSIIYEAVTGKVEI